MNYNNAQIGSEKETNNILIKVSPQFIENQFDEKGRYLFSYTVSIKNNGQQWVKLLSRHWIIENANGETEEVIGSGVVGYEPELKPSDSFVYTSYCPMDTNWGTMEGKFQFIYKNGEMFEAEVGRFYLVVPEKTEEE